jgi:hypothetical protein
MLIACLLLLSACEDIQRDSQGRIKAATGFREKCINGVVHMDTATGSVGVYVPKLQQVKAK